MQRKEIIEKLKDNYFSLKELVCPHVYKKYGDKAWMFLDTNYLHCLLVIRELLNVPMVCNNNTYTQRGLRCNICNLVKNKTTPYMSAHILGKGGDFSSSKMTAEEMRTKIKENADLLPCNIRMEADVNWLHFDVYDSGVKAYEFKV